MVNSKVVGGAVSAAVVLALLVVGSQLNEQFNIILPEKVNNQTVEFDNVILNSTDWTLLKNNYGVFAVVNNYPTAANATANYCELAQAIWDNEFNKTYTTHGSVEKYKVPPVPAYCNIAPVTNSTVPDFSTGMAALIMMVMVGAVIGISRLKHNYTLK